MGKITKKKYPLRGGIPPLLLIGALVVLFPIFSYITMENINRQKEQNIRMLLEKSAALIRAFEAGTRTGMMGQNWNKRSLQNLLTETAIQPDIESILVIDRKGVILAHSDPAMVGETYGRDLDLERISHSDRLQWRFVKKAPDGRRLFEAFRKFSPTGRFFRRRHPHHMPRWPNQMGNLFRESPIIFVGLNVSSIQEAQKSDIYHTIIMTTVLLFIGMSGIIIVFLLQRYQSAKSSLSTIKIFSDTLVAHMPIGIIAVDDQLQIVSMNPTAEVIFKNSAARLMGQDAGQHLPEQLVALIRQPIDQEPVIGREIVCQVGEGETITVEVSAALLNGEGGEYLGSVLLCKDISELKHLKKEVARSQRLASIGRLAAGVAHEVRNPLSSIKGLATYFRKAFEADPKKQDLTDIMIKEINRLNKVINQLIEIARPVAISSRPIDIQALIKDTLVLIEKEALDKGVHIQTDLSAEITQINVDEDRMRQVLWNLLINAIESTADLCGEIQVGLFKVVHTDQVAIQIVDNGRGISAEDVPHIFDPYFTTKKTGTGLGLAIVHNIVEAHQGEIKVESEPGKETRMTVYLPYAKIKRGE